MCKVKNKMEKFVESILFSGPNYCISSESTLMPEVANNT